MAASGIEIPTVLLAREYDPFGGQSDNGHDLSCGPFLMVIPGARVAHFCSCGKSGPTSLKDVLASTELVTMCRTHNDALCWYQCGPTPNSQSRERATGSL